MECSGLGAQVMGARASGSRGPGDRHTVARPSGMEAGRGRGIARRVVNGLVAGAGNHPGQERRARELGRHRP